MPNLSDELHQLFEAEARVQVVPARGIDDLAGTAHAARRRSQMRVAAAAACGTLVLAVGINAGAGALGPQTLQPGGTPAPPIPSLAVSWDPEAAVSAARAGFALPRCGDRWSSDAAEVGGVRPTGTATFKPEGDGLREALIAETGFTAGGTAEQLLGDPMSYVVTKDGVVVGVYDSPNNLNLFTTGSASHTSLVFGGSSTCDAQAAYDAVFTDAGLSPNTENLSDEEYASVQPELDAVAAQYEHLDSGTYTLWVISPVIFGEQLALGQALSEPGLFGLTQLTQDIGNTAYATDQRIVPYCVTGDGPPTCNPPADVLRQVLTRVIPSSEIVDKPSGVAISEPITVTVP